MLCKHCNAEVANEEHTCPFCGGSLNDKKSQDSQAPAHLFRADTKDKYNFYISKKVVKYVSLGLLFVIIAITSISSLISYFSRPDLTNCIVISTEGYNGYAYSSYNVNMQTLKKAVFGKESGENLSYEELGKLDLLKAQIEGALIKQGKWEHLCNGDESSLLINNLKGISNTVDMKFRNKTKITHVVSNLQEPRIIPIKDVLSPVFYGAEGTGHVQLVIDSNQVPFDIYAENNKLYIDHTPFEYKTSGNEGTLSNNDIFSLSLPESSQALSDIINKYGCGFDEENVNYSVSGLGDLPVIDIFSHVDLFFYGVSGDAEMDVQWKEENIVCDHYKIVKDDYNDDYNGYFSIYSDLDLDKPLSFKKVYQSDDREGFDYHVGSYAIFGNPMDYLTGGQIIDVEIISEDETVISEDSLNQYGFKISPCSRQETVDGNALSHYVTSVEQINSDMVKQYATSKIPDVEEYLLEKWDYITRGEDIYILLVQAIIKKCVPNNKAFIGKKNPDDNEYTLWLVYPSILYDDEMGEDKTVFVIATINSLQLSPDGTEIANYGTPSFDYLLSEQELAIIYDAFDHPENDFHEIQLD